MWISGSATEFHWESGPEITAKVNSKTLVSVETPDDPGDSLLIFNFADGSRLVFRYDYIYEWVCEPIPPK